MRRESARRVRAVKRAAAACAALVVAVVLGANVAVAVATHGTIFDVRDVPVTPIAVVFGAGVEPDGSPSAMLSDRLALAVRLYRAGKVGRMLLSGDDTAGDRETPAMLAYVLAARVPRERVLVDDRGFSTRDTCARARTAFGVRAATLVTQSFHLPRALFVCRANGVDAVGVGTPDWGNYTLVTMITHASREALATTSAALRAGLRRR